jgi:hypothetical protein
MNQIYDTYTQDPDETFRMYVERLMKAKPKFGGTFVNPPQGQGQSQGQEATAKATRGLLTGLFPEYADRMGGGGGDSGSDPGGSPSGSPSSSSTGRGDFASADDVASSTATAASLNGMGRGLSQLGSAVLGPFGMLLGLAPQAKQYYSDRQWDSFNRGQDSDDAARAEAQNLGGLGTFSDSKGNIGTFSSQAQIDAYDRAIFGVTGSGLAGGGRGGFTDMGGGVVGGDQSDYDGKW